MPVGGLRDFACANRIGSDVGTGDDTDDASCGGRGDADLETGLTDCDCERGTWSFFCFLRGVSVPLASERLGEPGRLRVLGTAFFRSICLPVALVRALAAFVEVPEECGGNVVFAFSGSDGIGFFSSSFLRSSSFRRSVSVSSDSLYATVRKITYHYEKKGHTSSVYGLSAESES